MFDQNLNLILTNWIVISRVVALEKCLLGEASSKCLKLGPSAYIFKILKL